jgi:NTE family protein
MAEKLAQTDAGRSRTGLKLAAHVIDHGDDPLIAYSLAASVAWHTRRPTLLLVVSDGAKPREELSALARLDQGSPIPDPCAHVAFCPVSRSSPEALDTAISEYALRYHHIVIQLPPDWPLPETDATKVYLDSERASAAPKPGLYTIRCRAAHGSLRPDHRGVLSVPPLTNTEREELRTGLLSTSGAAGKALGWAARDLAHLKVGVALGAGGSKGFGHLGVLEVLLGQGLPIDAVSGTSIGSCVAALYSLGYSLDDMTKIVADVGAAAWSPTFPRSSILSLRRLKRHFQGLTKGRRLEDLPIPTAIVAADMLTHRQVVFRRGLIWQALLASIAIPGAFPPQPVGGHLLVDGGVVNPVPSNVAADLGADIVIGVKLAVHTFGPPIETPAIEAIGTAPWIFHTMMRSMEIMQTRVTAASAETATIQIDLDFSHELDPGLRHFAEGKRFIELGRKAAGEALPRVAAALPWMAPQRGNQA